MDLIDLKLSKPCIDFFYCKSIVQVVQVDSFIRRYLVSLVLISVADVCILKRFDREQETKKNKEEYACHSSNVSFELGVFTESELHTLTEHVYFLENRTPHFVPIVLIKI